MVPDLVWIVSKWSSRPSPRARVRGYCSQNSLWTWRTVAERQITPKIELLPLRRQHFALPCAGQEQEPEDVRGLLILVLGQRWVLCADTGDTVMQQQLKNRSFNKL